MPYAKKRSAANRRARFHPSDLLCRDRTRRASLFAGTAIDAGIGIDDVRRIAGIDRADRASVRTCAAGNAGVRNLMCHNRTSILKSCHHYIINIYLILALLYKTFSTFIKEYKTKIDLYQSYTYSNLFHMFLFLFHYL